ncbi:hypothetical protein [Zhihengliuella halotolerans]|uniref:Uncharacterized protein n=1 Tax=Zhihengliuella halotolerans TaxID=370736 RepID=A0A4Q8AC63_9MICC|nr:hypothetical protein [Zhihengliuella halotolerans]RZU61728.1 hypothetical protein EV380_1306 [Zhihengliuella halotolerans]
MLTSILRTVIPTLWGGLITWLVGALPVLAPLKADLLEYGDLLVPVLASIIIGTWYALWRWAEPRLPAWLVRILLGSARSPSYDGALPSGSDLSSLRTGETVYRRGRGLSNSPVVREHEGRD